MNEMVLNTLPWTIGCFHSDGPVASWQTRSALMAWDRTPGILRTLLPTTFTFTSIPSCWGSLIHVFWPALAATFQRLWAGLTRIQPGVYDSVAYPLSCRPSSSLSMGLWAIGMRQHDDHDRRRGLYDSCPGKGLALAASSGFTRVAHSDPAPR